LESALHRPQNRLHYNPDVSLFVLAAAYAFGLAKNYPFGDGNKRIAYLAIRSFLHRNGHSFEPDEAEAAEIMVNLVTGAVSEDELAAWIEANSTPR
jgi:death-on-curing protein